MSASVSVPEELYQKAVEMAKAQRVSSMKSSHRRSPNNCPPGSGYSSGLPVALATNSLPRWTKCLTVNPATTIGLEHA
jgi:hypothetical protein